MAKFTTLEQKVSYGIGVKLGDHVTQNHFAGLELDHLLEGIKDAIIGKELQMTTLELEAAFQESQDKIKENKNKAIIEIQNKNEAFLTKNAQQKEIQTTTTGLQYQILTSSTGSTPSSDAKIKAHYTGSLIDGQIFDSSHQRGQALEFAIKGVIKGWQEALLMMSAGSKWKLFIPHHLGYGVQGYQPHIPPYATLIFEIELISFTEPHDNI